MRSALALLVLAASCSLTLDRERRQCFADGECARFGDAVCDPTDQICVLRSPAVNPDAAVLAPPDGGSPNDRAERSDAPSSSDSTMTPAAVCGATAKPLVRIEGDITASDTLSCDKNYLLVGLVFVKAGVTLTIAPGTTIFGDPASKGALVVQPGGRLVAVGTRDEPIVFTSPKPAGMRRPGDWGGVLLLGRAPVNAPQATIEGITTGGEYGGADPEDDSGALSYVRIEYSGTRIGPNNEINGLTLGGVGRRTSIDHVQVRHTADDCFEFFGGTVDARYLACQWNGDDGIDWDNGYRGRIQFFVLQQDPRVADETNGMEGDNDALGSAAMPRSAPVVYNATLCGKNVEVPEQQYGLLLRRATAAHLYNVVVTGFEAGVDLRDTTTTVELASSLFVGNLVSNVAYNEDGSDTGVRKNDDGGFDEVAWWSNPAARNTTTGSGLPGCFDANAPVFGPPAAWIETARTPPDDGFFDPAAAFVGAFRDERDLWATAGRWPVWSSE